MSDTRKKFYVGWTWTDNFQAFETIAWLTEPEAKKLEAALAGLAERAPIAETFVSDLTEFDGHLSLDAAIEELVDALGSYDEDDEFGGSTLRALIEAPAKSEGAPA